MNKPRQDIIDNRIFPLYEQEIITQKDNSISFRSSTEDRVNEGEISTNDSKKGIYNVPLIDKLRLILSAKGDFKFTNFKETPITSIAMKRVDASAVLDYVKVSSIK